MVLRFLKSSYENIKQALTKSGSLLGQKLRSLFQGQPSLEQLEQLEQLLYEADLGVQYAEELTLAVEAHMRAHPKATEEELLALIRKTLLSHFKNNLSEVALQQNGPTVVLIVGVNGNGKTTSVAKLANRYHAAGNKVLLAAADTFRAAAIQQLQMWGEKIGVDLVKGAPHSDPASVAFDAVQAAQARGTDILFIDTAGRLHNKTHLMQELEKIRRSCRKLVPQAPHETLLVLDATTGQNALEQAKAFHQFTPLTGIILTKLDGSAKGGALFAIQRELGIPIKFIGVGEGIDQLEPFVPESFVDALLS